MICSLPVPQNQLHLFGFFLKRNLNPNTPPLPPQFPLSLITRTKYLKLNETMAQSTHFQITSFVSLFVSLICRLNHYWFAVLKKTSRYRKNIKFLRLLFENFACGGEERGVPEFKLIVLVTPS